MHTAGDEYNTLTTVGLTSRFCYIEYWVSSFV